MSKHHISGNNHSQGQMNHYSNQHNPNNGAYRSNNDNHSNQLNPNQNNLISTLGLSFLTASNTTIVLKKLTYSLIR